MTHHSTRAQTTLVRLEGLDEQDMRVFAANFPELWSRVVLASVAGGLLLLEHPDAVSWTVWFWAASINDFTNDGLASLAARILPEGVRVVSVDAVLLREIERARLVFSTISAPFEYVGGFLE